MDLERKKFEGELVLKAVEASSHRTSVDNLRFFLAAGLLEDDTLREFINNLESDAQGNPMFR